MTPVMAWLGSLIGGATATGVTQTLNGVGEAAQKIRGALDADYVPAELKVQFETHLSELEVRIAEAQSRINEIEAASPRFFVAGWRPYIGWVCGFGFTYALVLQPLLAWVSVNVGWSAPPQIDTGAAVTMLTAMLGLGGLRTYEKEKDVHAEH